MSTQTAIARPRSSATGSPPGGVRRARTSALSASVTFAWRAMLKLKHVPEELGDVIGIPILLTLMFTYLFGGALAGSTGHYLQFLLPGTVVLAVVLVTIYFGVTLNTDLSTGAFDRFRSTSIWRPAPIIGGLIGDAGRYLLASVLVIALGLVMGFHPHGGAVGVVATVGLVLAFAFGLSWIWIAVGLVVRSHVDLNPISHLVTAARGLMNGTVTAGEVIWVLGASMLLVAVFAPLTMRLYRNES